MQQRRDQGRPASERWPSQDVPLVIEAQTTVWRGSLLLLAVCAYVKGSLLNLFRIAGWALAGRTHLERRLIEAHVPSSVVLPLDPDVLGMAQEAAAQGRPVCLATPTRAPLLHEVAPRHPLITEVIVTDAAAGEPANAISAELAQHFPAGFDLVSGRGGASVARHGPGGSIVADAGSREAPAWAVGPHLLRELASSLRPHQCVKNLIVFVPVMLGGRLADFTEVINTLIAFIALTCIASGTYLFNDIWDIAEDRKHWSKRLRPIAAGRLAATTALSVSLVCIALGVMLGFLVSWRTGAMLLLYLGVTLAYTLHLKTVAFVDGLVLATLFTIRLGIGAAAADVPPSPWLFVFSMFLFASLSYAKRHTEIVKALVRQDKELSGRGYRVVDAPIMLTVGVSSGIGAVMIMVLYIVEEAFLNSFYGSTGWLWGFPPLVFLFVVRIWLLSARGEMNDDPVAFAIRDRTSLALIGLLMLCFGFAWLG
jgi:4-hydroxybenzoate polyprenyltransferase